ncbi:MAG: universal stress protein [Cyclobacteriaceae bacterium]
MNTNSKILVPIDFSNVSQAGLATAIDVMSKTNTDLVIFNVVEEPHTGSFKVDGDISARLANQQEQGRYVIELTKKRKRELATLLSEYDLDSNRVESMIYVGQFQNVLESIVDERDDISLVIMGTSGETSTSEFFRGNRATQSARALDIPVLTVKGFEPVSNLKRLLLWVDKDKFINERMTTLSGLSNALDLQIVLLGVAHSMSEAPTLKHSLKTFAERNGFKNYEVMTMDDGDEIEKIAHTIKTGNYDAVATLSNKTSGFMRLFVGDDIEEMINEMDVPVIAVTD